MTAKDIQDLEAAAEIGKARRERQRSRTAIGNATARSRALTRMLLRIGERKRREVK